MKRARPERTGAAGLTLVELVVVLAVIAAIMAVALPAVRRGSAGLRLRAEAGRVAAVLREARQKAVTERRPTRITLEDDRHTVVLSWAGDDTALRRLEVAPSARLEAVVGGPTLTFSARGFTRDAQWAIDGAGGRRILIDVHGVTGRVSLAAPRPS